jgi:hypothetical protein
LRTGCENYHQLVGAYCDTALGQVHSAYNSSKPFVIKLNITIAECIKRRGGKAWIWTKIVGFPVNKAIILGAMSSVRRAYEDSKMNESHSQAINTYLSLCSFAEFAVCTVASVAAEAPDVAVAGHEMW